jgi:hypothetical protein
MLNLRALSGYLIALCLTVAAVCVTVWGHP